MSKLFVSCATLGSGGAERVLSVLSKSFSDEFDEVEYILWLHDPVFYKIDDRVKILDISQEVGSGNLFRKMIWFRRYVKKKEPDLILSFLYPWSMTVIFSLLFTTFKIVVAERQDPRIVRGGTPIRWLRSLMYRRVNGIIVQTEANSKSYKGDIKVIYNPVSISKDMVGKAIRSSKKKLIVSVGRLIPQKNHYLMISAFAEFYKTHPEYQLVIYGDGNLNETLLRFASSLGIGDIVHMLGRKKDVIDRIMIAQAFVLSSEYEGMPNALLEAMCIGLPCISTKVSGASDLIMSGINGILVEQNNVHEMAQAMSYIIDHDTEREKMSYEAIKVYDKLDQEMICRKWIDYINAKMKE